MAKISHKSGQIQKGKVGVESLWGFGDLCFNLPLIRAISEKHNAKVNVAVASRCKDALINIPWIDQVLIAESLNVGLKNLREIGCEHTYQITQNVKFYEFTQKNPYHSLIDTPLLTGRQIGLPDFDQRPIFLPTDTELEKVKYFKSDRFIMNKSFGAPLVAVESVYNSIQSWATKKDIGDLVNAIRQKATNHKPHVLWLSNTGAPAQGYVEDMLEFSRRECICSLQFCDTFISVGSGFFCACLALPKEMQPKRIICLWKDELYKYEAPLKKHQWHPNITWVHNRQELQTCIDQL
jgi:hypothetical protein